jgi:tetratricopeptide (TPR) repeat protein
MAFFPEEVFDQDMCSLAVRSFKTVFRYAPYILDDTYAYYFSHYNLGLIMMQLGQLDDAEAKFKYLLSTINPTLLSLPALAAGKGRNSLEVLILAKAHAALFLLNEDRAATAAAAAAAKSEAGSQRTRSKRSSSSTTASSVVDLDAAMANLSVVYKQQLQHQQEQEQRRHRKSPGSLASRTTSGGSEVYERGPTGSTAKLTRDFKDFPTIEVYR